MPRPKWSGRDASAAGSRPISSRQPCGTAHAEQRQAVVRSRGSAERPPGSSQVNLTTALLVQEISAPADRIDQIVEGRSPVTADIDLRLARFFGLSDDFRPGVRADDDLREQGRVLEVELAHASVRSDGRPDRHPFRPTSLPNTGSAASTAPAVMRTAAPRMGALKAPSPARTRTSVDRSGAA